jgi:hypothetical protein
MACCESCEVIAREDFIGRNYSRSLDLSAMAQAVHRFMISLLEQPFLIHWRPD